MKFFIDTANVEAIRRAHERGMVDGVTTNPTLVAKEGRDFRQIVEEIASFVKGPISLEVVSEDAEGMMKEARELNGWIDNAAIKIPMTWEGLKAVKMCAEEGIKTNVTLVFSPNQALLAAKAGATFVSPFIGRLDDVGHYGMQLVSDIVEIYNNYDFETEVIVASVRHPVHVYEAALIGADIVTMPPAVLDKMVNHPLTDVGIKRFLADWEKVRKVSR
ncbi:MAG: fructose-6-phosphate aldolase [Candidatus Thorarchaeota archaeon]|nr:MAG: fructose-6-phosphate aldolase [Candidatus Thorarchaeota archaeon]RLI59659.1 MAG: fructose-6-phosphate aldolase [Candidatus Thorarchaeota archaeon]